MQWLVVVLLAQPLVRPPTAAERMEALDEMQAALGQWQRERQEFNRDAQTKEERAKAAEKPEEVPVVDEKQFKKVIEVGKGTRGTSSRLGKVIQVAPDPAERSEMDKE